MLFVALASTPQAIWLQRCSKRHRPAADWVPAGFSQVSQTRGSCHHDVPEGQGTTEESESIQPQGAGEPRRATHALTSSSKSLATCAPLLSSGPLWTHSPQFKGPGPTFKDLRLSGADHMNNPLREGLLYQRRRLLPALPPSPRLNGRCSTLSSAGLTREKRGKPEASLPCGTEKRRGEGASCPYSVPDPEHGTKCASQRTSQMASVGCVQSGCRCSALSQVTGLSLAGLRDPFPGVGLSTSGPSSWEPGTLPHTGAPLSEPSH